MRTRLEIETILFRASAILQGDRHMVFGIKDRTIPIRVPCLRGPGTKWFSGTPGYSTYVAGCTEKGVSSQTPSILPNSDHAVPDTQWDAAQADYPRKEGLFIAQSDREDLWDRFPHAIARMYAMATQKK